MKIFIFLHEKPLITETFIVNELDILEKFGIGFKVGYLNKKRLATRQRAFRKYQKKFIYIRRLPIGLLKRIAFVISSQLKIFITHPVKYLQTLFWILTHFRKEFLRDFFKLGRIIPLIDRFKPDLFLTRYPGNPLIYSFLASKFYGRKYGLIYYYVYPNLPYIKHIDKTISFIIVKAKYIKDIYLKRYSDLPKEKIKVLPEGIDTQFFQRKKEEKKNKLFTILVISQLVEKKGIIYLLKACWILKNKKYKFKCSVYGDGPEKEKLIKFIKMEKLEDSIDIKPAINAKNKLKKTYLSADLFVLPSIMDRRGQVDVIPNVLLEAMAMEVPVVTTRINGMGEIIKSGVSGFLVKEKDEVDLANKVIEFMKLSKEERDQIGKEARKTVVKYFDKEKCGKKLVDFLRSQAC